MYNVIVCVCFFNLFLLLGLVVKSLSGWGSEMNTAYCDTIPHPECMHTSTNTLFLSPVLAWRISMCGSALAKIISGYLQAWSCMNALSPSVHNMMCFLFCVCFDPSLAAELRCGEQRARVALLCYFWQQRWLVAVEERGDRRGIA